MQAFREAYLFTELKELLQQWTPMLDSVLDADSLASEAALDAHAAASAAFDVSPLGLRFRVPSAGFLLIWTTSPESPARRRSVRRVPSDGAAATTVRKRHPASQRPTRSDDVLVQLGRPPIDSRHSFKSARLSMDEPRVAMPPGSRIGDMGPPPEVHCGHRRHAMPQTASH